MSHEEGDHDAAAAQLNDTENENNEEEDNNEALTTTEEEEKTKQDDDEDPVDENVENPEEKGDENDDNENNEETQDQDDEGNNDEQAETVGDDDRREEENVTDGEVVEKEEEANEDETAAQDEDAHEEENETAENAVDVEPDATEETEDMQDENTNQAEEKQELTDEERTRLRYIFDKKAVSGRLDLKGFKAVFRLMGEVVSSNEAEEMFEDGDKDDNNSIDFEEICRLYSKFSQKEHDRKEAIMTCIDKLFPGCDGEAVQLKQVKQVLLKLQQPDLDNRLVREKSDLGAEDINDMIKSMDVDGSGCISKQELVNILCQHIDM